MHSRAVYAQSTVRRFARWLENERIAVHALYGPLISKPSPRGETIFCTWPWIRPCDGCLLSGAHVLVYRGRAIPLVWKVLEHSSSSVAHDAYSEVLDKVAELLPFRCPVVFTADREVSQIHISWPIWRDWVGIGEFVSKEAFGFTVMASVAAK